jgi:hypothetical protein
LTFYIDELLDDNDPFFLLHAAMLLQITASLKLAEPKYSQKLLNIMTDIAKERFAYDDNEHNREV